jgi:outer membrane receptor for ferrienterochelin and colicins
MNRTIICAAGALLAASAAAHGQSLDYGALEKLFGEPVTTSVTGSPQRASDVPATMEIVTADDIRRSGARTIPDVLRHVAGVDVLQWGNDDADVSIRGYNQAYSSRLLVLIDGRQVYADFYGFTPWSALPVELADIRQIEIVKGPQSALFGFNAVGGVINIITYNPLYDSINTASLTGGTQDLAQGSAVATVRLGDGGGLRLSAGGRSDRDFATPTPPGFAGTRNGDDRGAVDMNAVVPLNSNATLGLDASHVTAGDTEVVPGFTPAFVRFGTSSAQLRLDADTRLGLVEATAYTNWIEAANGFGNGAGIDDLVFDNRVTVLRLQDTLKLGTAHTLRETFEYRNNTEATTSVGGGSVFYDVIAAGGMWEWKIAPALTLTNALRLDHLMLGRSGSIPVGYPFGNADWGRATTAESFNSGLVWRASEADTVRLMVGRGVQLPNLAELGAALLTGPLINFTGRPNLVPTVVTNYEIGWDRNSPAGVKLHLGAFHQTTEADASTVGGLIVAPGGVFVTSANVANSVADGLELQISGRLPEGWRWGASYTPEVVHDHFFPGETNLSSDTDFQHATPRHVVNANLGWSRGKWEIDGFLRYESHFLGFLPKPPLLLPTLVPVNDYVTIDGRVGYRLTDRVTLALSGQNLQRATTQQTSGPNVERRVLATVTVKF